MNKNPEAPSAYVNASYYGDNKAASNAQRDIFASYHQQPQKTEL